MELLKKHSCKHFEEHGFDPRKEISTVSIYCRKKQRHISPGECRNCKDKREAQEAHND